MLFYLYLYKLILSSFLKQVNSSYFLERFCFKKNSWDVEKKLSSRDFWLAVQSMVKSGYLKF